MVPEREGHSLREREEEGRLWLSQCDRWASFIYQYEKSKICGKDNGQLPTDLPQWVTELLTAIKWRIQACAGTDDDVPVSGDGSKKVDAYAGDILHDSDIVECPKKATFFKRKLFKVPRLLHLKPVVNEDKSKQISSKVINDQTFWLMEPVVETKDVFIDLYHGDATVFEADIAADAVWNGRLRLISVDPPYGLSPWDSKVPDYDLEAWGEDEVRVVTC